MSTGSSEVRSFGEPWFLGESQLDPGEWDFDGTIWCPPSKEEIEAEKADPTRYAAEPYCIAEHVDRVMAERIVACVNMLAGIPTTDLLHQPTVAQSVRPIGELVDAATEAMAYLIDDINEEGRGGNAHILYLRLEKAVKALKGVQS